MSTLQPGQPPFLLMDLPYEYTALEPYITENTLRFHHQKHHQGYINALNSLLPGTEYQGLPLEAIVSKSFESVKQNPRGAALCQKIFNNAAQVWNHDFYWNSMAPKTQRLEHPEKTLATMIERDFGSFGACKAEFLQKAGGQFGSGWVWICINSKNKLEIISTSNAHVPWTGEAPSIPLLVCDVWEHAYYLDYQNLRIKYAELWWDHLAQWQWAQDRYDAMGAQ